MNTTRKLTLTLLADKLAVCRLKPGQAIPTWATTGTFFSVTKTLDELSIICPKNQIPSNIHSEKDWRAFKLEGPFDFSLTGILSSVLLPMAEAGISILAVSTFDTDYVLVKAEQTHKAINVLNGIFTVLC
jgi:uncharacterized protein